MRHKQDMFTPRGILESISTGDVTSTNVPISDVPNQVEPTSMFENVGVFHTSQPPYKLCAGNL